MIKKKKGVFILKKVLAILMAVLMVLSLAACGKSTGDGDKNALQNGLAGMTSKVEWTDNLYDYQIKLDDVVYQFPMTVSDFLKQGWSFEDREDKTAVLEAEAYDFTYMTYKNGGRVMVEFVNFAKSAVAVEDVYVGGVELDEEWWEEGQKSAVMAKDITVGVSTETDITAAYGSPVDTYEGETYKTLEYGADYHSEIVFQIDTVSGKLTEIEIENLVKPENFKETEVSDEVPDYVKKYQAPTALGTDVQSGILEIDGALYQMPIPVSAFLKNGWTLQTQKSDATVAGTGRGQVVISKNGKSLDFTVKNYAYNEVSIEYGVVENIYFYNNAVPVKLPGGIYPGMAVTEMETVIANTEYTVDTSMSSTKYYLFAATTYYDGSMEQGVKVAVSNDEPDVVNNFSVYMRAGE